MTEERSIELEVEVIGTPEEVWRAIATGPGISSWYVPHTVEEREGGAATATFGPDMVIPGRVAEWDPPHRIVFDGGEDAGGMAFQWTVEARDGGVCVVRLVNSGFGSGDEWDDQFDAMTDGWALFLRNLQLHLEHFGGQSAVPMLLSAAWPGTKAESWRALVAALGISAQPQLGSRLDIASPRLGGIVVAVGPSHLTILLDEPSSGVAFLAAEGSREPADVSVWAYLYGDDVAPIAKREQDLWRQWLDTWVKAGA